MKDIGKKVRDLREQKGLTQEELAHKVGYKSRVSINKIELQRDIPIKKLKPIADALEVDVRYLMGWDTPEESGSLLGDVFKDPELMDHVEKLNKLSAANKQIVYNMIDALMKGESSL